MSISLLIERAALESGPLTQAQRSSIRVGKAFEIVAYIIFVALSVYSLIAKRCFPLPLSCVAIILPTLSVLIALIISRFFPLTPRREQRDEEWELATESATEASHLEEDEAEEVIPREKTEEEKERDARDLARAMEHNRLQAEKRREQEQRIKRSKFYEGCKKGGNGKEVDALFFDFMRDKLGKGPDSLTALVLDWAETQGSGRIVEGFFVKPSKFFGNSGTESLTFEGHLKKMIPELATFEREGQAAQLAEFLSHLRGTVAEGINLTKVCEAKEFDLQPCDGGDRNGTYENYNTYFGFRYSPRKD